MCVSDGNSRSEETLGLTGHEHCEATAGLQWAGPGLWVSVWHRLAVWPGTSSVSLCLPTCEMAVLAGRRFSPQRGSLWSGGEGRGPPREPQRRGHEMAREDRGLLEGTGHVSPRRTRWLECRAQEGWESPSEPLGVLQLPWEPQPRPLGIDMCWPDPSPEVPRCSQLWPWVRMQAQPPRAFSL